MAHFVVGIDLGTANCAMAFTDPSEGATARVLDFPIPQLVRAGEPGALPLLPSVIYLPFPGEFPAGSLDLPWGAAQRVVGTMARAQAGRVPHRAITSAKSWLIHSGVDRRAAILPPNAPSEVQRLSPVAAQAELLRHMVQAWNAAHLSDPLSRQEVVLTIPASFDEAARALTLEAARDAGLDLQKLNLLEEPQAAFYDFTSRHRARLAQVLSGIRLVLVVDVGGGTTDFSLVQVAILPEGPALKRLAVGDHLLLGGDNMDAALGRLAESKAFSDGRRFTGSQWTQALEAARAAKEALLGQSPPESVRLSVASGGSKLVGNTVSVALSRSEVEQLIVEGFFPEVTAESVPQRARQAAVVELGLPYAQDAAITRHLVAFLREHAASGHAALGKPADSVGLPRPDAVLLNGGVFNSPVLAQALVKRVSALWGDAPEVALLPHDSLDLAVARGAAYSGLARRALGQRIGGGAPRAFYALLSGEEEQGRRGVCLIPRGLEEGNTVELTARTFALTLGKPVQFQLYSTTSDRLDKPGDVVSMEDEHFVALPPIHTILEGPKGATEKVHLVTTLTEVGTVALSLVSGERRWRLEFELKGQSRAGPMWTTEAMPARFSDATLEIERVFGTKPLPVEPKDVKNLFRTLERVLGPKETWRVPVLRELWTALWSGASKRRRSVDHEKLMFQLLGFSLRPGVGYPLDEWRCSQTFTLFRDLVTHHAEQPIWAEFWILWRRIAGGLPERAQLDIWQYLKPHLQRRVPVGLVEAPKEKVKGIVPLALDEMVRCAGALELLEPKEKSELGGWVSSRLTAEETVGGPWAWALGRLGARVPVHGAAHRVVEVETAAQWTELLLKLDKKRHDGACFALACLARKTGDRSRDLDASLRERVLATLCQASAPESWKAMVTQVVELNEADEARALGDSLPVGLAAGV